LAADLSAGFTVAVMHIPQGQETKLIYLHLGNLMRIAGMAYALLAGTDPIVGIYTAFFPVALYVLMGTSRHISLGTFAVVSILCSKVVSEYGPDR